MSYIANLFYCHFNANKSCLSNSIGKQDLPVAVRRQALGLGTGGSGPPGRDYLDGRLPVQQKSR
jgi:hypothetical protein